MMTPEMIATLPIWVAGLLIAGVAVVAALMIELLVRRTVPMKVRMSHTTVASAMFNVIGTTYAVLLAFVAMLAWNAFDAAQSVTSTEASLVLEVFRLVDGFEGADAAAMREDIAAYAHSVVDAEWPAQARGEAVVEEDPGLVRLSRTALRLRPGSLAEGDIHARLLGDLAALGNARRERLLIGRTPIPLMVWFVLLAGGSISVAFSSFLGAPSLRMHLVMSSLLALSGALVLLLIVALSNPFRGDFRVSAEPFQRVLARMAQDDPAPAHPGR